MLADDIAAALPGLRAEAEARMADTFEAFAATTGKVDGLDTRTWGSQGTTPGRLAGRTRGSDPHTRTVTIGDVEVPVLESGLHLPLSAPLPAIGWEYVCTDVGPSSDPSLLGRRWRVVSVPAQSNATARRLDVVEV